MTSLQNWQKLGLLGSLYMSQYIPVMFLIQALPIFMRQQGASLDTIGALSLLGLPLIFKFLWSPLIDRYGSYRLWIITFQLLAAVITFACAFLDVQSYFSVLLLLALLICTLCASQDIATDALAVGLLSHNQRGLGNGIQVAGHELGILIGGGGILILLNDLGWKSSLLILAMLLMVTLIPIFLYQEPQLNEKTNRFSNNYFGSIVNICRRPQSGSWILVLLMYMAGGNMANTMFRPLLVDLGLSLRDIGWLEGIVSHSAGMIGAIITGLLIATLGRKRSLIIFGLFQAFSISVYLIPISFSVGLPMLYLVAIITQVAMGASGTVLFTVIMDKSQLTRAGTDFTTQTTLIFIGSIGGSAISGVIAKSAGYTSVFVLGIAIALLSVVLIAKTQHLTEPIPANN